MAFEDFSSTKSKPIKTSSALATNTIPDKLSRKPLQIDEIKLPDITVSYYQNEFKISKLTDNINVKCPFHNDKNPSLSINLQNGAFKCHSPACGVYGTNIIGYHSKRYNLSFIDTVRHLGVEKNGHGKKKMFASHQLKQLKSYFHSSLMRDSSLSRYKLITMLAASRFTGDQGLSTRMVASTFGQSCLTAINLG